MIRSEEDLVDKIASDRSWRIKEIQDFKNIILSSSISDNRKRMLYRAGVALLYAHWEGFVKKVGSYFLEYVAMQRLTVDELKNNFITLIIKGKLDHASNSKKYSTFGEIADFLLEKSSTRARVPYKGIVNTESNLSTKVLREIVWCLGLEYRPFEVKEKFIDSRLVDKRNHIAHGEEIFVDEEDMLEIIDEVLMLMEEFRNQVENAAILNSYKKSRP